jgi:hypothetical protein
LQRDVLRHLVATEELWNIGNLIWEFRARGLSERREVCAALLGQVADDCPARAHLRTGLQYAEMGCFFDLARPEFESALRADPDVISGMPESAQCWLLYARVIADVDPEGARRAVAAADALEPGAMERIPRSWSLHAVVAG